jgi:cytochrome c-type biogenesis protein CcmH/NrfG
VVIVDAERRVVFATPGFVPRFKDLLAEALLVATGRESNEQFEKSLGLEGQEDDPALLRVERLLRLGDELARHGLGEMAEARYREAISLRPEHVPSRLALGRLLVREGRLDDAESQFREALAERPESADAILALAGVQIARGGDELSTAERALEGVLERDPGRARAHYLMGLIYERRGEIAASAAAYRRAAEILLDR